MAGRHGVWSRANELASRTRAGRNRYVDFLRGVAILVVVVGHWLMAAPTFEGGPFSLGDMLELAPWSQWLTWGLQVMPILFMVGGYANAASWESSRRAGRTFGVWSGGRLQRLIGPIVPLVCAWAAVTAIGRGVGADAQRVAAGARVAFIPTWFLAVYVLVVVAAPGTYRAWRRFGMASFWGLAAAAAGVDAVAFLGGVEEIRWINFAAVWLAIHQLGYAWRDGALRGGARALPWAAGGLAVLVGLVWLAGYPVSMITVPGGAVSNSAPPTLALLALGVFHAGLVLAAESPARRWLARSTPWTATVLLNQRVMTIFLWHATALVLLVEAGRALGGLGLRVVPGSAAWWASRTLWIGALFGALALLVWTFGRFERPARRTAAAAAFPAWRSVAAALAVSGGLTVLVRLGTAGGAIPWLPVVGVLLSLGGAALVAAGPFRSRS